MEDFEKQFSYNSLIFLFFMLIHWVVKLFISSYEDKFELPNFTEQLSILHLIIVCVLFVRLILNFCLWRRKFDVLLFFAIYCAEFYESFVLTDERQQSSFFSYFTFISICFISLFLKFKLKDMCILFILYMCLYLVSNIVPAAFCRYFTYFTNISFYFSLFIVMKRRKISATM